MKNNINRNLDIIRVFALFSVLIYHASVVLNFQFYGPFEILNSFLKFGGEVGVTLFFLISGYSIFCSIDNKIIENNKFSFHNFILKRLKRIYPEYIFSIIFILLFTSAAIYISNDLTAIISHIFLFHNLFVNTHGAISGVLWTMGVIFQFYLFSYPIYKLVIRKPKLTLFFSIVISILIKIVFYALIIPKNSQGIVFMIYGRQLITALDNFVIGMFIAYVLKKKTINFNIYNLLKLILSIIICILFIYYSSSKSIYSNELFSYFFHTLLALLLGLSMHCFMKIKINYNNILIKPVMLLAKYEYGIYIWHLLLMENLLKNSAWFNEFGTIYKLIAMLILSIMVGIISTVFIGKFNFEKVFSNIKIKNDKIVNCLIIVLLIVSLPKIIFSIKEIGNNVIKINHHDITRGDKLENIVSEINDLLNEKKGHYTYIFVDNLTEEGYMNYYRMRYYLTPNSPIHYNNYITYLQLSSEKEIINYLNKLDVDYIFVRDWFFLEDKLNYKAKKNILIYKLNKEYSSDLKNKLIPLNGGVLK